MLVIIGYDPDTKNLSRMIPEQSAVRIINIRNVLFDAIWEYPSGPKLPDLPKGALKKGCL